MRQTKIIGTATVHKKYCSGSSMDWAKELFDEVGDGTLFIADEYEMARGRQGRAWKIYPEQIMITAVLKPSAWPDGEHPSTYLTMALSIGVTDALRAYDIGLKWPNDFVAKRAQAPRAQAPRVQTPRAQTPPHFAKVGGMIMEAVWHGTTLRGFVVGIAINCMNEFASDDELHATATSLQEIARQQEVYHQPDCAVLHDAIIASLDSWYDRWQQGEFEKIFTTWRMLQVCKGETISVHYKDGSRVTGCMKDVDRSGSLILVDELHNERIIPFYVIEDLQVRSK